jgi:hypothetical protein
MLVIPATREASRGKVIKMLSQKQNTVGKGGGGGKGAEMTQTLYAHTNERKKKETK